MYEQTTPDEFDDLDRWRHEMDSGHAMLYDPATGQRLNPQFPPVLLGSDSHLGVGFQYLAENGNRLGLQIFYGNLTSGESNTDWYKQQLTASVLYGYEGRTAPIPTDRPNFSFDQDCGSEAERAVAAIDYIDVRDGEAGERDRVDRMVIKAIFNEWRMVGRLGYELRETGVADQATAVEAFVHVSAVHADLTRKFRAFGVAVGSRMAPLRPELMAQRRLLAGIQGTGIIPPQVRSKG